MINTSNITGIILSGGKSSRMGTDKGFIKLKGKTFIEHSIEALKPLVSETIIISNNKAHDAFNLKRYEDIIEDAGPLAGVYTGLKHSKTDYNLVLSCDIPLINTNVLTLLIEAIDDTSEVIQIENNHKTSPLIAVYKSSCASKFYKLLVEGERRLRYAVNQCKVKHVKLNSEIGIYTSNINTPEELKMIKNDH
jgi:molybdopterin-guanine dinucleotide biosynthesis protein A